MKPDNRKGKLTYIFVHGLSGWGGYDETYKVTTSGVTVIGEEWMENDGLVNTVSAMAPMGAPSKPLERDRIEPGIWNVLPTFDDDHMALQGGLTKKHDIKGFYTDLLGMIDSLA